MPNDHHSSQGRRPHYQRGRRGPDRRGPERRTPPQSQEQNSSRDHVDVEQIMRDIRSRIAKRHGIDLTPQQIHELAARRLDAILEPRHVKPSLMEQMRRAAGAPIDVPAPAEPAPAAFDEATLYESHRGIVRLLRKWLNPILKLFFNPTPIAKALDEQARRNNEAARREAEMYAQQAEWNALHYEILQRLVTDVARASIETQNLAMRVESLATRVDFNERRVRSVESSAHQRGGGRVETPAQGDSARHASPTTSADTGPSPASSAAGESPAAVSQSAEGTRRRRRRRRGRRSGSGVPGEALSPGAEASTGGATDLDGDVDGDDSEADGGEAEANEPEAVAPERAEAPSETAAPLEPAHAFSLLQPVERHPQADLPAEAVVSEPTALEASEAPSSEQPAEDGTPVVDRPEPGASDR